MLNYLDRLVEMTELWGVLMSGMTRVVAIRDHLFAMGYEGVMWLWLVRV